MSESRGSEPLRLENRLPGGGVNPYLAISAMIAAGLRGIDNELALEDETAGNAYEAAVTDWERFRTFERL